MPLKIRHKTAVEWGDCDPAQQIFYPNYFRWFDIAWHRLMDAAEIDPRDMYKIWGVVGLPLVEAKGTFRVRCRWMDSIEVESWVSEWRSKTFTVTHTVWNRDVTAVEGYEIRVFGKPHPTDPDRLKAGEIPQSFKDRFA